MDSVVADRADPNRPPIAEPPRRPGKGGWLGRRGLMAYGFMAVLAAVVLLLSSTTWALPEWLNGGKGPEGVLNGSVTMDLNGWSAAADVNTITLTPVRVDDGPDKLKMVVDIQRKPGSGKWAMALADLRKPKTFFKVGRIYQMRAYVRDLNASGDTIGMLLANDNHTHQPTDLSRYDGYLDTSWHLLVRTFIAQRPAFDDTRLYFALPPSGALHWQITGASVREIPKIQPPTVRDQPIRTLTFTGPAGTRPDPQVWNYELGGGGWGNNELQTYTAMTSNAQYDGAGNLVVTARRQKATGPDDITRGFTSARLNTKGTVEVRPGSYVEATIRVPGGQGVRPAFWLIGSNIDTAGWPAAGELDVVEASGTQPTMARSRIHISAQNDPHEDAPYPSVLARGEVDLHQPLADAEHTYGVYFDDTMVRFYVDRREHLALSLEDAETSGRAWPFNQPYYMVVNVAVNGATPASVLPQSMVINRIAIWEGGTPF